MQSKLYLKYGKARLGPIFDSPTYIVTVWVVVIAFELYIIHIAYMDDIVVVLEAIGFYNLISLSGFV